MNTVATREGERFAVNHAVFIRDGDFHVRFGFGGTEFEIALPGVQNHGQALRMQELFASVVRRVVPQMSVNRIN